MASVVKAIKPEKIKWGAVAREINKGVQEGGEILLAAHERVTRTWKTDMNFKLKVTKVHGWPFRPKVVVASVSTKNPIWLWLDKGTKTHPVTPKKPGGVLAFPSKFASKSKPNSLGARKGFSGGPTWFSKGHKVKGIKPRNFTPLIEKKYGPKFRTAVNKGFTRAARASGQGK